MTGTCVRCAAPTVEITLFKGEGALSMRSCSNCDHRVWLRDGQPTSKSDMLDRVGRGSGRRSA